VVAGLKAEVTNRTSWYKTNKLGMMDPLIYISIPWRDLTHLLELDVETQTKSMPERLQRLMDKQPEQEDDVRLTTADLQWIKDQIPQVGASQFVDS
jgi:hypothetical protein